MNNEDLREAAASCARLHLGNLKEDERAAKGRLAEAYEKRALVKVMVDDAEGDAGLAAAAVREQERRMIRDGLLTTDGEVVPEPGEWQDMLPAQTLGSPARRELVAIPADPKAEERALREANHR